MEMPARGRGPGAEGRMAAVVMFTTHFQAVDFDPEYGSSVYDSVMNGPAPQDFKDGFSQTFEKLCEIFS